jgi:phospholipid transport system substrate-binding protein
MRNYLAFILATLVSGTLLAVPVADPRDPDVIVEQATTHIMDTLNARRDEFTADSSLLLEMVNQDMLPLLDIEYSARLILGREGRNVSQEELEAFATAMSEHLLSRYAEGILGFNSDEQLEVLPLKGKNTEKLTRVRTRFKLQNGGYVPVDFAFRKTELGWKAFDVTIEGISYVMTYRNQIAPRVAEVGIDQVTADIRAGNISLEQ